MRSHTSPTPGRRTLRTAARRSRRRPAIIATGLALAVVAAAGTGVALPTSQAQAQAVSAPQTFALASYSVSLEPAPFGVGGDRTSRDARAALLAAKTTIASAAKVATDIQASGLDVGVPVTTVDTDRLEAAVDHLEDAALLPAPLVSAFSAKVTAAVESVDEDVNGLRGRLDAAIALKAEQEAAAQAAAAQAAAEAAAAQAAAEAAAAAAAAEAEAEQASQASSSSNSSPSPAYAGAGTSAGEAQAIARGMLAGYGWGDDQFGCLVALWDRESGWNSQAYNSGSGAYGIPQALPGSKMATAGADWQTNAATQISWGLGYIAGRYGNPCGAWNHSESVGWY
ncbi:lytic transglycosylase domain-containing protein [uncultured Microbacterium sp.]|uniref:aggregation-promoting factor C-terminal-like domain-containing protein n=1 Tax=uncultured Microbacterium sp. TaxID=191216 RepID=UPI0028D8C782|nr:lytic transglycosylase domain-containing protein [uncultured Microbacterium sp.]